MRFGRGLGLATAVLAVASGAGRAQDSIPEGDWRNINRDAAATRFSPLDDINRSNVAQLREAWSYPFRSFNTAVPLVIDGTMYVPAGSALSTFSGLGFSLADVSSTLPAESRSSRSRLSFILPSNARTRAGSVMVKL